ncbi:hypothetical protein [Janthinobacterium sp. GW458P]|uniref:hypothetical protein n=1 Tax=Janthinobacterium sp. GW458P TaxID=1981504 RepID=UPI0015567471|nr:hypothetical protein [Janthinobacterium sp. GW458P]MBE3023771.1 hypothetical protein [Janthinobacterium sp. GW458P]
MHGLTLAQGVMQRSMVKCAQIAPEPYQGSLNRHYFLCLGSKIVGFSPFKRLYGRSRHAFDVAAMAIQCKLPGMFTVFRVRQPFCGQFYNDVAMEGAEPIIGL